MAEACNKILVFAACIIYCVYSKRKLQKCHVRCFSHLESKNFLNSSGV